MQWRDAGLIRLDRVWHTYLYAMKISKKRGGDVSSLGEKGEITGDKPFLVWGLNEIRLAVVGSFTAVVFGLVILVASLLAAVNPMSVYPQSPIPSPTPTPAVIVKYYLPYPGILPDNPLYKIKALRDRIVLFFTSGEENKAVKELLYADKRIRAAEELVDGGKATLGVSTASKAEKYLESSVNRAKKLSNDGKDVKSLLGTLSDATAKHLEVLQGLQTKTDANEQKVVMDAAEKTKLWHDEVETALENAK